MKKYEQPLEFAPRLARGPEGKPVVARDEQDRLRYLYHDGSYDRGSEVSTDNRIVEVAGHNDIKRLNARVEAVASAVMRASQYHEDLYANLGPDA